jgi:hypothetical protein
LARPDANTLPVSSEKHLYRDGADIEIESASWELARIILNLIDKISPQVELYGEGGSPKAVGM